MLSSTLILLRVDFGSPGQARDPIGSAAGNDCVHVHSAAAAIGLLNEREVAVVVIDATADQAAWQLAEELRQTEHGAHTPLIFITANEPPGDVARRVAALAPADWLPAHAVATQLPTSIEKWERLNGGASAHEPGADVEEPRRSRDCVASTQPIQLLLEAEPDYALFYLDARGHIQEWTANAQRLFGYVAAEALGADLGLIFSAADRAAGLPATLLARAADGNEVRENRWYARKDGTRFSAISRLVAMRDAGGLHGFAHILRDATAQKAAAVKLHEALNDFQNLADHMSQLAWMADPSGRRVWFNRRWLYYAGGNVEDMMGWGWTKVVHPDFISRARSSMEAAVATSEGFEQTIPLRGKTGEYRWFLSQATPVKGRDGGVQRWVGTCTDINEDVVLRQQLTASEEQFRAFFDSAAAGHAFVDPTTQRFLRVNQRLAGLTGYTTAELEQLTLVELTHPGSRRDDEQQRKRLHRGEAAALSLEKRYVRKDGRAIWVQETSTVLRDGGGAAHRQLCVIQDMSERKAVELELAQRSTQLQLAVETAELGTFFNDDEAGSHVWNEQNKRLLGLPPDGTPSMESFLRCVHPDDRERVERKLHRASHARPPGREFALQYRVLWPDGSVHHIAARGRSFREAHHGGKMVTRMIGTARDITAMKKFERELQRQVAQRTAALQERTEQLEAFSYTVAHDLRSPLRSISGYANILATDCAAALGPEGAGFLEKIQRSAERMDALICDLLAFSRIMQMHVVPEAVSLHEVVHHALNELHAEIQQRRAEVTIATPLPVVTGERSVLEQIVLNLLSNALKFVARDTTPHVTISAIDHGDTVTVRVTDNGIGIAAAYQERIFRVFERLETSREYPGTGVGLAIVAKAVERLGGRLGVESTPGQGSTFWFELKPPSL